MHARMPCGGQQRIPSGWLNMQRESGRFGLADRMGLIAGSITIRMQGGMSRKYGEDLIGRTAQW